LLLNTLYGFWVESYRPDADPLTQAVTIQSAWLISLFERDISVLSEPGPNIPITQGSRTVIEVFEGCNGLNVMIVFLCFVVAFSGTVKKTAIFCFAGVIVIYLINLLRVSLLFFVSKYYHEGLYFFHKYAFTGGLYVVVFVMWYLWVQKFRDDKERTA
jgi:exosortase family protein XrtF